MPVFPVQIINNVIPALTIEVADSGVPPVTYEQILRSLGAQVYQVDELYIYSENFNQLLGVIQYQRFDADGNQKYSSIATTVDPYSGNSVATVIDLRKYFEDFILNGNSSFSTTILQNTFVQIKFWANRVTNEFGANANNFRQIEKDANKPNFYGLPSREVAVSNAAIKRSATLSATVKKGKTKEDECNHLILLGVMSIAMGAYMMNKEN